MAESRTISIRLDEPDAVRLDELAAAENTSGGILGKRVLLAFIQKGVAAPPIPTIDVRLLAAEITKQLREDPAGPHALMREVIDVLRQLTSIATRSGEENRAAIERICRDLIKLCSLLEEGPPEDAEPPTDPDAPKKPDDGSDPGLLKFDD